MRVGVTPTVTGAIDGSTIIPVYLADNKKIQVSCKITQPATSDQNQIQTITAVGEAPYGVLPDFYGGYRLTDGLDWTGSLGSGLSAASMQLAVESLAGIGTGNVQVTSPSRGIFILEFIGDLANKYVKTLGIADDTQLPGFIGGGFWLTGEVIYARLPQNPWFTYAGLEPAGLILTLRPLKTTTSGSQDYQVYSLVNGSDLTLVTLEVGDTAATIQSKFNAAAPIGAGGVSVLGGPFGAKQVQIKLSAASYFARIASWTNNTNGLVSLMACDRLTMVERAEDGIGWFITGASWTY